MLAKYRCLRYNYLRSYNTLNKPKGGKVMTEAEDILVQIGEFIYVEMEGIKKVTYGEKSKGTQNTLVILTTSGKEYILEIKPQ